MIPYGRQEISQCDVAAVVRVLQSNFLTQGPVVPQFEQAVANYCGAKYGVAVNSATSALHIACLTLELGRGDWLWTSPNTFVASANAALYCGGKVDFVDIDPRTYNICPQKLERKLEVAEKLGKLPKIVMPVHYAGQPCDMAAIYALSERYGFKIIEDASHAIGASYSIDKDVNAKEVAMSNSEPVQQIGLAKVGSCTHSHVTVFSFHPVKIITAGEGGMAMTNNAELADRMMRLRSHGTTSAGSLMHPRPDDEIWNYQQIELGFNYRMTDIQAALGLSQLKRLSAFISRRCQIADRYTDALKVLPITTPYQAAGMCSSYHLYPVRISKNVCGKTQQEIFTALVKNGVAANLHYIPVHRQPYFEKLGFKVKDFPEAEQFHRETISLPIFSSLTQEMQDVVIGALAHEFGL